MTERKKLVDPTIKRNKNRSMRLKINETKTFYRRDALITAKNAKKGTFCAISEFQVIIFELKCMILN